MNFFDEQKLNKKDLEEIKKIKEDEYAKLKTSEKRFFEIYTYHKNRN